MSLPATDSFTGTNGDPLSANWTTGNGSWQIFSNSANPNTGGVFNMAKWNADVFANDQYSQATINLNGASFIGPMVRTSGANGYLADVATSSEIRITRLDAGASTDLQTITGLTINVGDLIRLQISGTTLKVFQNGVQRGTDQVDATYASGSAGIGGFSANGQLLDNWQGGNVTMRFILIPN